MKKSKKKFLFILIVAIISGISLTAFQANAASTNTVDDIEYSYEGNISAEKAEQIIKSMFGIPNNNIIQPFSIFCIFGHSIEKGGIKTTEHNYYPANPKCKETYTNVEYCTRNSCDYYAVIDERSTRAACH